MRTILALASATLMLAACSGDNGSKAENGSSAKTSERPAVTGAMRANPGLWETKITFTSVDAKGMPKQAKAQMLAAMGKGITVKTCLTEEQAEKPGAEFFGSAKDSQCAVEDMQVAGTGVAVSMMCKPDAAITIESKMTGQFSADSYAMDVKQKTSGTPMGYFIAAGRVEGKRLGNCPA